MTKFYDTIIWHHWWAPLARATVGPYVTLFRYWAIWSVIWGDFSCFSHGWGVAILLDWSVDLGRFMIKLYFFYICYCIWWPIDWLINQPINQPSEFPQSLNRDPWHHSLLINFNFPSSVWRKRPVAIAQCVWKICIRLAKAVTYPSVDTWSIGEQGASVCVNLHGLTCPEILTTLTHKSSYFSNQRA